MLPGLGKDPALCYTPAHGEIQMEAAASYDL